MTFTTKFNHGDTVYFYNDHMQPTKGKVDLIMVEAVKGKPVAVDYRIKVWGAGYHWHEEKDLFTCRVPKIRRV
jgi:hypothetical protein